MCSFRSVIHIAFLSVFFLSKVELLPFNAFLTIFFRFLQLVLLKNVLVLFIRLGVILECSGPVEVLSSKETFVLKISLFFIYEGN